jgi:hypothetical protein
MSLKELTREKHAAAEGTRFMKAVFDQTLPLDLQIIPIKNNFGIRKLKNSHISLAYWKIYWELNVLN